MASKPAVAAIAAGMLLVATAVVDAGAVAIYKCPGDNLSLIYTDQPCRDGKRIEIDAGNADPAAAARLREARDQLDRSAAARIVEERIASAQRYLEASERHAREEEVSTADYGSAPSLYDYALGWYPGFVPMRPPKPRPLPPRPAAPRSFAPNPPYIVPRS